MIASALDRLHADTLRYASQKSRAPLSTYRLQLHAGFGFRECLAVTPYLAQLGVTHAYASPILAARAGSMHGYDTRDHSILNPELGSEEDFTAWLEELKRHGMGLILDAVPNHMCVGCDNRWWADVLEHGPASPYAHYFDIAWYDHPRPHLHGKLLLPILGDRYGEILATGGFRLSQQEGRFWLQVHETRLPIDPRTYGLILGPALERNEGSAEGRRELRSILDAVTHLSPRLEGDAGRRQQTRDECEVIHRRLQELPQRDYAVAAGIHKVLEELQHPPGGGPRAGLAELIDAQAYRLCFWRVASDEINYRRFFDVTDLAALSTERPEVFSAVHAKLFELLLRDGVDGLRIDHPDGLYDPKAYLEQLQVEFRLHCARHLLTTRSEHYLGLSWEGAEAELRSRFALLQDRPLYVVVEKILERQETLPDDWACEGTTGYDSLNAVNELFVDPAAEDELTQLHQEFSGREDDFDELVYQSKILILRTSLSSELHMLAHQLDRLAQRDPFSRDFTLNGLRHALQEVIACFPIYRTYVDGKVRDHDRAVIQKAVRRARNRAGYLGRQVFDFLLNSLLLKSPQSGRMDDAYRQEQLRFVGKFQQVTSPIMAKGFEDTALYIFNRLVSLNEVGSNPGTFGRTSAELHRFLKERSERGPLAMNCLSTHDTKRSEDARARLHVLSEVPHDWSEVVLHWQKLNRTHRVELEDGLIAPDPNDEYLYYQNLLAVAPTQLTDPTVLENLQERLQAYMQKAIHEAKGHTSWLHPHAEYDEAVKRFVARTLDRSASGEFLDSLTGWVQRLEPAANLNILAQTALKLTIPGVPDTYQGTEWRDLSLVDPDNRRPVDYPARQRLLNSLPADAESIHARKMLITTRLLHFRQRYASLMARGFYQPLILAGPQADHFFAFLRCREEQALLVVVPRLMLKILERSEVPGQETSLALPPEWAGRVWCNLLAGEHAPLGVSVGLTTLLQQSPVAVWTLQEPASEAPR